jgi:hypothetical protein
MNFAQKRWDHWRIHPDRDIELKSVIIKVDHDVR